MLLTAALGGGVGLGVLLVLQGLRGRQVLPERSVDGGRFGGQRQLAVAATAVGVGLAVWMASGWPVAGLGFAAATVGASRLLAKGQDRGEEIDRVEAIATWVEMLRDTMAGAKGLEDALLVTAPAAPPAIAEPLHRFASSLRHRTLEDALEQLGEDLNHPAAALVVAGLRVAAQPNVGTGEVGQMLTRLAESVRGEVSMRLRVRVSRAELRTSTKVVMGCAVAIALLLAVYGRELLAPYRSLAGQLWLLLIFAIWVGAIWLMQRLARLEMPERFASARKEPTP